MRKPKSAARRGENECLGISVIRGLGVYERERTRKGGLGCRDTRYEMLRDTSVSIRRQSGGTFGRAVQPCHWDR